MIKIDKQNVIKFFPFLVLVGLYLSAQAYKIMYMAPLPDNIWDNVVIWDWARSVGVGDFSAFSDDSHHRLRWGNWIAPAILVKLFSDNILIYFFSTIIPSILASLLFSYFVWRYIGLWQTALFLVLWFFDSEMFKATFQLLPTGQSLLPISIVLLLVTYVIQLKNEVRPVKTYWFVVISMAMFWLYGVKETYMAFFPAVAWLMWQVGGFRALKVLTIVMLIGYVCETVFYSLISDSFPVLGRIFAILNSGAHIDIMLTNAHHLARQTRYFDSGITMRWAVATGVSSIVFYMAFIASVLTMAQRQVNRISSEYKANDVVALMLLSFIVFTTFFIISISPIRLGQPLVSRYLGIGLPFSYIILLYFVSQQLKENSRWFKLSAMCIVPFYIAPAINRFADYPEIGIHHIADRYYQLGQNLNEVDCVKGRNKMIFTNELDLIPKSARSPSLDKMIMEKNYYAENHWYIFKQGDGECETSYSINRVESQRY